MIARVLRGPGEGWLAVALVYVLAMSVGFAMDDVAWVLGRSTWTDVLPLCAAAGVTVGLLGPKVGWSRWTTHLVGALFAGVLLPIVAGFVVEPGLGPAAAFRITADGTVAAWEDLFWRGRRVTPEVIHYVLSLGVVCWATGQFGAYAVFGHRRPLNAVVVMGLVLLTNMALTSNDQLRYLVVFTAGALFLLIGMHAFDERTTWVRRRIGDPSALTGLYFKGGSVFVAVTLVGSLFLTDRAASAPLAGAWDNVDQRLLELGEDLQRYFPTGGAQRGAGISFSDTTRIPSAWSTDSSTAFRVTLPPEAVLEDFYWRAGTWDSYDLTTNLWEQSTGASVTVVAGDPILDGTSEAPLANLSEERTFVIRPDDGYRTGPILSPASPVRVDREVRVETVGDLAWFSSLDGGGGRAPYAVTALVPIVGDEGWNANVLRATGRDYPADLAARYATDPGEAIGPDARALLDEVLARAGTDATPYDLASTIVAYLRSPVFTYDTDVSEFDCRSISVAECFARTKQGYCLHYASTMILLLRDLGIPSRLAQGFLPGDRILGTQEVVVANRDAHAWVEVWFPGYGWYPFDPTGGSVAQLDPLPSGPEVTEPMPTPGGSSTPATPGPSERVEPDDSSAGGGGTINRPNDPSGLFVVAGLLALIVGAAIAASWWRGPRGVVNADSAWRSMSRLASRFGFAPRPTETVYEYAATLGDALPVARPDLQTVARAKVEFAYGRATMTEDRLASVREATRRLRVQLLRLAIRRRGGRPRGR